MFGEKISLLRIYSQMNRIIPILVVIIIFLMSAIFYFVQKLFFCFKYVTIEFLDLNYPNFGVLHNNIGTKILI